ncbi:MAG: sigma-54-dependent transcriptional regulator [Gemmatimonadaceae bacterium]
MRDKDPTQIRVLLAEDEASLAQILATFLSGQGHHVTSCGDGRAALEALRTETFDVALLDIVMPELDGLEVLRRLRDEADRPEVIIITGNGTIETAISAMKLGAYDYISKPYRMAEIDILLRRAWEKRSLVRQNALLESRLARADERAEFLTRHDPLKAVLAMVERVAKTDSPVLITGESGTGKELVARALHRLSKRAGPLVDVNCAALAEPHADRELFGHERGAFDNAPARRAGLLELATGGTLFLDEVSELEPRIQGKLLRALEQGSFFRVGGTQKVQVDVRLVASTNRDLARLVSEGRFRNDLLHRINAITIALPPLRARPEDISLLAERFLAELGGPTPPALTSEALAALRAYTWPGNVRELRNVIERAVLLASGPQIRPQDLPLNAASNGHSPGGSAGANGASLTLAELERRHIEAVLTHTNWHQGRAAVALGISSKTLYRKIREYGFRRPQRV